MKRMCSCLALAILALTVSLVGQAPDVNKIVADTRAALGGEKKLSALKTVTAAGQSVRVTPDGSSSPVDWEMAFELPDKFIKKDVMAMLGTSAITRTSGFNGDTAIDVVDQPPAMPGMIRIVRSSGGDPNAPQTPEQQEQNRKNAVIAAKQDFSRILLGFIASSSAVYPLEFSFGGVAEAPDGKADMIDAKGEGGFAARFFIDQKTHLPLMLSWMAKEPLVITRTIGGPGGAPPPAGGGNATFGVAGGKPLTPEQAAAMKAGGNAKQMTPEEMEKFKAQAAGQAKEAESKLRVVEYRLYYGDYRDVNGVKVPFRLQRSIDGKPTEEVTLEKVKINSKVDPGTFSGK